MLLMTCLGTAWTSLFTPCSCMNSHKRLRRQCCAGQGNIPEGLLFCACEPQGCRMQEVCWWKKLVQIQAHSALRDLTPREGGLMTNTAHSGPWCISIATCRHFKRCFPTHTSSTKSTYSQCLGMDSPAPRLFIHSPYITTTAVTLIFPCPDDNAAMACCLCPPWVPFSPASQPASQPCMHSLNPICTEAWQHSRLPWLWLLLHRLLHTAITAPQNWHHKLGTTNCM